MDKPKAFHTEWNVREKQIFCINSYIWNLKKIVLMNLFAGQEERQRYREWTSGHREVRGDSGTNWESSVDIYTLPCVA